MQKHLFWNKNCHRRPQNMHIKKNPPDHQINNQRDLVFNSIQQVHGLYLQHQLYIQDKNIVYNFVAKVIEE